MDIHQLTVESFGSYGWLLGKTIPAFSNRDIDFWREHIFDAGIGGAIEMLWVNYKDRQREITSLEVHRLTEQAVIPLTGDIIQVVAMSQPDGSPDINNIQAFQVHPGQGLCMRPGCWHTTRVDADEAVCLMLTRTSTTTDLVSHLTNRSLLTESTIALLAPELVLASNNPMG